MTLLTQERERLAQQVQSMTGVPGQPVRAGVVDTRVIGKPDQFDGDPMKYADWSFKLGSYLGAVDQRYQQESTTTETSSRTQRTDVLHSGDDNCRSRVGQVSQCRRERGARGLEAVRFGMEPKLRTRYVGLLMNVLGCRFRDDIPTKLAAFERTVHDYENQSTKDRRRRYQDRSDDDGNPNVFNPRVEMSTRCQICRTVDRRNGSFV